MTRRTVWLRLTEGETELLEEVKMMMQKGAYTDVVREALHEYFIKYTTLGEVLEAARAVLDDYVRGSISVSDIVKEFVKRIEESGFFKVADAKASMRPDLGEIDSITVAVRKKAKALSPTREESKVTAFVVFRLPSKGSEEKGRVEIVIPPYP